MSLLSSALENNFISKDNTKERSFKYIYKHRKNNKLNIIKHYSKKNPITRKYIYAILYGIITVSLLIPVYSIISNYEILFNNNEIQYNNLHISV